MSEREPPGASSLRSVGNVLGDLARRVGDLVAEVSDTVTLPEAVRQALAEARRRRFDGDWTGSDAILDAALAERPDDPHLHGARPLGRIHAMITGEQPPNGPARGEPTEPPSPALAHLLAGAERLAADEPATALDALRRASRTAGERSSPEERRELRWLIDVGSARAHAALGDRERAIRDLHKARLGAPPELGTEPRRRLLELGAQLLLAEDRLLEAERWLTAIAPPSDAAGATEILPTSARAVAARIAAARGDSAAALAWVDTLEPGPRTVAARLRVGLCASPPTADVDVALAHLRDDPRDPERLRLWALVELARWPALDPGNRAVRGVLDALRAALSAAPPRLRAAHRQELALAALQADALEPSDLLAEQPGESPEPPGPEAFLWQLRRRIAHAEDVGDAFEHGRVRLPPDLERPAGPDEISPLRDPRRRHLPAQAALAEAEWALARGQAAEAEQALVRALVVDPQLARAAALMRGLSRPSEGERLEDLLAAATRVLGDLPATLLGVDLEAVPAARARVIAARERLARSLTIAIMGEFSSGKSTFVNALLGEDIAPTGALPTTSTINVFRPGTTGRARVHYRDGTVATIEPGHVHGVLHGLDTTEAGRIRFVEIERTRTRLGDTAVVDTPGLNALDAFHERVAREFLDEADAVVWIFSATRGSSASEAAMLAELREGGRRVLGVLNKVDILEPAERAELSEYLRRQLGDVLVGVVPVAARDALAWRRAETRTGPDPFAEVEAALETRFLAHARDLKREITARRLRDALAPARDAVATAVEMLERRALQAQADRAGTSPAVALDRFAEDLHGRLLGLADLLVREALALELVSVERGLAGPVDTRDAAYLDAVVREGARRALRAARAELRDEPSLVELVAERFEPWAEGWLAARTASQRDLELTDSRDEPGASLMAGLLARHGTEIRSGERALEEALRGGLHGLADDWRRELRNLHRELEWSEHARRTAALSRPRAEALRLRARGLVALDGLLAALVPLLPETAGPGDRQPDPRG
jgi:GTP-binding protein EngB required for normal cell division